MHTSAKFKGRASKVVSSGCGNTLFGKRYTDTDQRTLVWAIRGLNCGLCHLLKKKPAPPVYIGLWHRHWRDSCVRKKTMKRQKVTLNSVLQYKLTQKVCMATLNQQIIPSYFNI